MAVTVFGLGPSPNRTAQYRDDRNVSSGTQEPEFKEIGRWPGKLSPGEREREDEQAV